MRRIAFTLIFLVTVSTSAIAALPPRLIVELSDAAAEQVRADASWLPSEFAGLGFADARLVPVFYEPRGAERHALWMKHGLNRWFRLEGDKLDAELAAQQLKFVSGVRSTFVSYPAHTSVTPNDYTIHEMWGLTQMQCPEAWDVHHGDSPILVTTIDTGCDITHADLAANIHVNPGEDLNGNGIWDLSDENGIDDDSNEFIDDITGWDFVSHSVNSSDTADGEEYAPRDNRVFPDINGHGTHVMGTAAGVTDNGIGVAAASWNVVALPLRAGFAWEDDNGWLQGSGYTDDFAAAIQYATDNGVRVVSISFGGSGADPSYQSIINFAREQGTLILAAAGNENHSVATFPAAFQGVMAVAATQGGDRRAGFSNFGGWVDIAAPGVGIWSTLSDSPYHQQSYASWAGTSMATPNAAAVAGLIWNANPNLTDDDVERILLATADNFEAVNPNFLGLLGTGRVNAFPATAIAAGNLLPIPQMAGVFVDDVTGLVNFAWLLDDSGRSDLLRYRIYRDGELIDSTVSDIYEGPIGGAGFHRFGVSAVFAAGESAPISTVIDWTPSTQLPIVDDFESGLAQWSIDGQAQIVTTQHYEGGASLMVHSTTSDLAAASAVYEPEATVTAEAWFRYAVMPTAGGLQCAVGFADIGGARVAAYVNSNGSISVFDQSSSFTPNPAVTVPTGTWTKYVLHCTFDRIYVALVTNAQVVLMNEVVELEGLDLIGEVNLASVQAGGPGYFDHVRFDGIPAATHFQPVQPTLQPYMILISSAEGCNGPLVPPAEIAVYDGNTCVGMGRVSLEWPVEIQTYGNEGGGGFTPGNTIEFRIWSPSCGERVATQEFVVGNGTFADGVYARANITGVLAAEDRTSASPASIALHPAYPNPFNASTTLTFELPASGHTKLSLYNSLGQHVRTMLSEFMTPGAHEFTVDASGLPSGLYLARLESGSEIAQTKLLLLK